MTTTFNAETGRAATTHDNGTQIRVFFGWVEGLIVLALIWLPTELMTYFVTPPLLACISIAYAIGVKDMLKDMGIIAVGDQLKILRCFWQFQYRRF